MSPIKLNNNLSVLLYRLYLDFFKTFVRVNWDFIFSSLQKFKYGDKFVHMINVPYTSIQSKIKINGVLSDPLTLMRGVRQRFPLSMLLSIIAPDKLANFIDDNKKIKGIQIENYEIKIVNFSDNTTIF